MGEQIDEYEDFFKKALEIAEKTRSVKGSTITIYCSKKGRDLIKNKLEQKRIMYKLESIKEEYKKKGRLDYHFLFRKQQKF